MTAESLLFFFLAAFAVTTAILMVMQRNPLMSAIYLIGNFFALAGLYLILRAQLLAVLMIAVYTGAIMVLVIFVIMLLNLGDEARRIGPVTLKTSAGIALVCGLLCEFLYIVFVADPPAMPEPLESAGLGTVESLGSALFGRFLLPFELTSILLLAAIVGAVVLARKRS
ncbi:MAG: NADH-ubiquinone oxidoreductase chain [Bacteroidetes bacterium]|nr:NADH-ubiquinone oxidoreductase chain [Bacteroidota bacterium]